MNNDNSIIICAKLHQSQTNHLSEIAAKINKKSQSPDRYSAFMRGKKKGIVMLNRDVVHSGTFLSAEEFLLSLV